MLDDLIRIAESAAPQDPRLAAAIAQVEAIRAAEPRANILIDTEYTDRQAALVAALQAAGVGPVITVSGEDDEKTRATATARFRTEENLVFVSTDAAAEGLNLHQRCHHLLHLELPFNPNRLEQRNGRIDRFGQDKTPIVRYLFLCGTFEQRVLLRLIAKYERQRKLLTFVPNTLGVTASAEATAERLLTGLVDWRKPACSSAKNPCSISCSARKTPAPIRPPANCWRKLTGAYRASNAPPVALRHEAQTVLTLFKKRREDLDAREAIRDPEVTTLGMLMIAPRTSGSSTSQEVRL